MNVSTSGGDIAVAVVKLSEQIRISNSGGNIKLTVPKNSSVNLSFSADRITTEGLENFSGKIDKDHPHETMEGKLNGGGIDVIVRADGGRILFELL